MPAKATPDTIDRDTLLHMLNERRPVTILDVHKDEDRAEWSIPGSVHVDAYAALNAGDTTPLGTLDLPTDRPVVAVCGAGKTSLLAMQHLRRLGYDARSLTGGMKAWSLAWNTAEVPLSGSTATVTQFRRTGKGCLSYLIGSRGKAAVIDASLDPDIYQDHAKEQGWQITHVLDTHIHADHLSRSRTLADRNGATLFLPDQRRVAFSFAPFRNGDSITIGEATLTALATPGHTMESTSYLLDNQALFTGDTLFLGAVGRPDLEASTGEARTRAHRLHRSLEDLTRLPGRTVILPGHSSQPAAFDGEAIAAPLSGVLKSVHSLTLAADDFVDFLITRIPPAPPNHAAIVGFNEAGELPDGDPTDLEAGANRCAIA